MSWAAADGPVSGHLNGIAGEVLTLSGEFFEQIVDHLLAVAEIGAFEFGERVIEIDQAGPRCQTEYAQGSGNLEPFR